MAEVAPPSISQSKVQTESSATPPSIPSFKPIHSLVLDTGPLIKNDPPASVLIAKAEQLYTLPCIIQEIRDAATRSRVETTLLPFITLRSPRPESVRFISGFAKKTGDLSVLSRPDLEVLALGYELECERNGGDWRLRNTPDQQRVNGRPPARDAVAQEGESETGSKDEQVVEEAEVVVESVEVTEGQEVAKEIVEDNQAEKTTEESLDNNLQNLSLETPVNNETHETDGEPKQPDVDEQSQEIIEEQVEPQTSGEKDGEAESQLQISTEEIAEEEVNEEDDDDDDDDDEGWITPSNLKKHQAKDSGSVIPGQSAQKTLQAAILTSDYAMQNVALRMNLNLVTPSLARITQLKNWVLRCHGCFTITKDMDKQFCPKCGQPTLTRTSCSTDQRGNFVVHLKRNFQWNNRGNVFSVPKPTHGSSNGRLPKGAGGKNAWGTGLIMSEDQKEFTRAEDEQRRARKKDLLDEDYLPGILTGSRPNGAGGKIKIGASRNINSRRKR